MNHNRMHMYLLGAAAIAAVLVIAKVPLAGILPFGLLFGCALMMFFMMKGMGPMSAKEDHRRQDVDHGPAPKVNETPDRDPVEHRS